MLDETRILEFTCGPNKQCHFRIRLDQLFEESAARLKKVIAYVSEDPNADELKQQMQKFFTETYGELLRNKCRDYGGGHKVPLERAELNKLQKMASLLGIETDIEIVQRLGKGDFYRFLFNQTTGTASPELTSGIILSYRGILFGLYAEKEGKEKFYSLTEIRTGSAVNYQTSTLENHYQFIVKNIDTFKKTLEDERFKYYLEQVYQTVKSSNLASLKKIREYVINSYENVSTQEQQEDENEMKKIEELNQRIAELTSKVTELESLNKELTDKSVSKDKAIESFMDGIRLLQTENDGLKYRLEILENKLQSETNKDKQKTENRTESKEENKAGHKPESKIDELLSELQKDKDVVVTVKGKQTESPIVWIAGATKPHKEAIKAAGGRWSEKRAAWYIKAA